MGKRPGIVEFVEDFGSPQSVRARIEFLKADNARMKAAAAQRTKNAVG